MNLLKNRIVNYFVYRIKRKKYEKNYKQYWKDERSPTMKDEWDIDPLSFEYGNNVQEFLLNHIKNSQTILEYGCGFGRILKLLNEKYNNSIKMYGVDISQKLLEDAKINIGNDNVSLKQVDGEHIPFPDKFFDLSYTSGVLTHVPEKDYRKICKELIRVTKHIIIHIEYSTTYSIKFPHKYKKFYNERGYNVIGGKRPDVQGDHMWYTVFLEETKETQQNTTEMTKN